MSTESKGGVELLIAILLFGGFGLAGKWILNNPHRVFPEGLFSKGGIWERTSHFEITIVGTFMVFGGAAGVMTQIDSLLPMPEWLGLLAALSCGVLAAVWVRRDLRQQPAGIASK